MWRDVRAVGWGGQIASRNPAGPGLQVRTLPMFQHCRRNPDTAATIGGT